MCEPTALLEKEGVNVQCTHGHQLEHTATDFVVRMIAGAVTTHIVFVVHYHLHATTTFLINPSFAVEYLSECRMSSSFHVKSKGGWAVCHCLPDAADHA